MLISLYLERLSCQYYDITFDSFYMLLENGDKQELFGFFCLLFA